MRADREQLLRCIYSDELGVLVDVKGSQKSAPGRGVWLHARPECIEKAAARGFSRSLERRVVVDAAELRGRIAAAAERRLVGLVRAARARRVLVFGRDAVAERGPQVRLAIVAADAPSLLRHPAGERLLAAGKLVVWGTKQRFGEWLGRADVAILAICDDDLAAETAQALALMRLAPETGENSSAVDGPSVSEVR